MFGCNGDGLRIPLFNAQAGWSALNTELHAPCSTVRNWPEQSRLGPVECDAICQPKRRRTLTGSVIDSSNPPFERTWLAAGRVIRVARSRRNLERGTKLFGVEQSLCASLIHG